MQYRKLAASKIFDGYNWMKHEDVLIVSGDGHIYDIVNKEYAGEDIEHLEGILLPGLINCHCHLELSHLKNILPEKTGLVEFLLRVVKQRGASAETILEHAQKAEEEMDANGIVAVADICNTVVAAQIKRNSQLYFHNLIEVINLYDENLERQLLNFNNILDEFKGDNPASQDGLTPHAPYSVSKNTFKAINQASANSIISIHNQETEEENALFRLGRGGFLKLYEALGAQKLPIEISGKSSLQTWLPYFTEGQTLILVHNTFIQEKDIVFAKKHAEQYGLKVIYCLCPNANLYIENALPPIELFLKYQCAVVLGTDSYSSNWQLNIASEMKTLKTHFPNLALEEIFRWATINGADALNQTSLGRIEKGKAPGLVLLEIDALKDELITGKSRRIL